ncbi:MAG: hypothetical protein LLG37_06195 [Spirochaetia bacterium]|nr:hypothetical protein [Spirochaetia bacterium]
MRITKCVYDSNAEDVTGDRVFNIKIMPGENVIRIRHAINKFNDTISIEGI